MSKRTSDIEGILNVDKPAGPTSHDVVKRVRRACQTRRVGHAGTLDPIATGVLVLAVGRATRLIEYVMGRPKTYAATVRLGQTTNTYDTEGEITAERPVPVALAADEIDAALDAFRGEIEQVPPMYSALKKEGQPLYKLARQGREVERDARAVTVYGLDVVAWQRPVLDLRITCSAGTYIRSIAHDLGERLGCGGHLIRLRRTAVGPFTLDTAFALADLTAETVAHYLLPPDAAVQHLARLDLSHGDSRALQNGRLVPRRPEHPAATLARAYDADGRFIGVVRGQDGRWRPKKMFL